MNYFWCLILVFLNSSFLNSAFPIQRRHQMVADSYARHHKQARVLPGVVAVKKLVLLKFKKIVPISLILVRSNNANEAELLPVYPTSEIPSNVQFISTPNGISGHKDVQAIAVPNEFQHELEMNGFTNIEGIEALLNQAEVNANGESSLTVAESASKEDEPLNIKEDDEDQLLDSVAREKSNQKSNSTSRRSTNGSITSSSKPQISIEETPIYLYSTKDNSHSIKHQTASLHYSESID